MHIVSRVGIGKIPPSSPLYLDVGGAVNFDSTLRVIGQTTVNSLISSQLATDSLVYESRIEGEANVLFSINRDGKIEWGSGGLFSTDVNLYRSNINTLQTNGSLIIDQSLFVGNHTSDTAVFTARIASNFDPSVNDSFSLGQDLLRWQNLWLSAKLTSVNGLFTGDLQVDNNTILGNSNSDSLTVNAFISSELTPFTDNIHNLGSLSNRWKSLWLGSDLQVDGNTILGDNPSDTVTINAGFTSPLNPSIDNFYHLGTFDYRWKTINLGPFGVVVRNDTIDDQKVSLYFNSNIANLNSSDSVNLVISTGLNNGVLIDTLGRIGINYANTSILSSNFNVNGTSTFADLAQFDQPSGYGLKVKSVAGIEGSVESANTEKQLNIGINAETEFVNLGTGSLTKTINIGTGSGKTTINIGGPSDIININGTVSTTQSIESFVSDKTFTLNVGGLNNTAQNSGLIVEEANAIFLAISDPTWQSGNTVRYFAADTGNIKIGSTVFIDGFFYSQMNGQFIVTALSEDLYFEVQNENVNNSSFDEVAAGTSTNPSSVAKILLSPDRNGWMLYSPTNYANYFKLTNLGADAELKASSDGLVIVSDAVLPEIANTPLGSILKPWNGFLNELTVYEDATIGVNTTNTLTVNSLSEFNGQINSDFVPAITENYNLGSNFLYWQSTYTKNLFVESNAQLNGIIVLGLSASATINAQGRFISNLVPASSTFDLGEISTPWQNVYSNKIILQNLTPGSITFINSAYEIAQNNNNLFWNNTNSQLYIGQNSGDYILDIASAGADSIRLRNTSDSHSIAVRSGASSNKIEFTSQLEFGVETYANVGSGSSTPVMQLTSSQIKLLGAVSVNSVSIGVSAYTIQPTDVIINVDSMSSGCVITLPSAVTKRLLVIKDIGNNASAANRTIQITPALNEYVEFNSINMPLLIERDGESVTLQSDGNNRWYII